MGFYAQVFRVPEYFWFDRRSGELVGYRLSGSDYVPIEPNERGWLWSAQLGAYLGVWVGEYRGRVWLWLRLWDRDGNLVLTREEREARERAERERLQAELERIREALRERGIELE